MGDLNRLLAEFMEAHLAGKNPDPWEYVNQLDGAEREELEELIDAYYIDAPAQRWDAEAFSGSAAERAADALDRAFRGQAGLWPSLLPRLRDRAHLKRRELVGRLAASLDVTAKEEKVARYYHEMEQGLLPSEKVSEKVLEALASIVGTTAGALRRAGQPLTPEASTQDAASAVFARTAQPAPEYGGVTAAAKDRVSGAPETEWDEVDELFLGGQR
jgi:hypothetical protein